MYFCIPLARTSCIHERYVQQTHYCILDGTTCNRLNFIDVSEEPNAFIFRYQLEAKGVCCLLCGKCL
jgi:hypothetical protein